MRPADDSGVGAGVGGGVGGVGAGVGAGECGSWVQMLPPATPAVLHQHPGQGALSEALPQYTRGPRGVLILITGTSDPKNDKKKEKHRRQRMRN